ncbi:MAG: hypothetical protein HC866_17940 [Leptolyngbyaceae cyanobacterium RU_5_1]|nr:hypothetical protein [Leptolyngbyaceae cyanobacterium RU_5_1]
MFRQENLAGRFLKTNLDAIAAGIFIHPVESSITANVITIWQQDEGSATTRFVTLYPDKFQSVDGAKEE